MASKANEERARTYADAYVSKSRDEAERVIAAALDAAEVRGRKEMRGWAVAVCKSEAISLYNSHHATRLAADLATAIGALPDTPPAPKPNGEPNV
jgi:ferric-dicitrate binding protein FerR (iron transport regulator)